MTHENYESRLPPSFLEWLKNCIGKILIIPFFDLPKRNFSLGRANNDVHFIAGLCYLETLDSILLNPFKTRSFFRLGVQQQGFLGYDYIYNWEAVQIRTNPFEKSQDDDQEKFRTTWLYCSIGTIALLKEVRIYGYDFKEIPYPPLEPEDDPEDYEYEGIVSAYLEKVIVLIYEDGTIVSIRGSNHDTTSGELEINITSSVNPELELQNLPRAQCGLVSQDMVCLITINNHDLI